MKYSQFVDERHVLNQLQKNRFIKFFFLITAILVGVLALSETPLLWEWYTYRSQLAAQKAVHFSHQTLVDQYKAAENELQMKEKRKKKIHSSKKVISELIYAVLLPSETYTISYCKQEKNKARVQGRAKNIEGMHEAVRRLEEKSEYHIVVDSFEKKERGEYIFSFVCTSKNAKKRPMHT